MTTAVIVNFEAGARPEQMRLKRVRSLGELGHLDGGRQVPREVLASTSRWSALFDEERSRPTETVSGPIRLRQICRVHRGQVTGGNRFFVLTRQRALELGLSAWCRPAITQAEEILDADGVVRDGPDRKVVLALPRGVDRETHPALNHYLGEGEEAHEGEDVPLAQRYIAVRRQPWWHLGKLPTPPIVASYMARRAPAFALNPDGLVLPNIGHGLYPVSEVSDKELAALVRHLNNVRTGFRGHGRTYHGGLEKFEPREMENLIVPDGERWLP